MTASQQHRLDFTVGVFLRVQMEFQIVETFTLEVAQRTAKVGRFATFVLKMAPDVSFEFVLFGAAHATVDAILTHVIAAHQYQV